jgi:hypothetical protein
VTGTGRGARLSGHASDAVAALAHEPSAAHRTVLLIVGLHAQRNAGRAVDGANAAGLAVDRTGRPGVARGADTIVTHRAFVTGRSVALQIGRLVARRHARVGADHFALMTRICGRARHTGHADGWKGSIRRARVLFRGSPVADDNSAVDRSIGAAELVGKLVNAEQRIAAERRPPDRHGEKHATHAREFHKNRPFASNRSGAPSLRPLRRCLPGASSASDLP